MTAPDQSMLTVAEVAKTLRCSTMTVYRLVDRDELRAFRVGRSLRVSRRDFVDYLRRIESMPRRSA